MDDIIVKDLSRVRVESEENIRIAAEHLHNIALRRGFRAAPAHDIADKRTPVDKDGDVLADSVFGWGNDESAWWRNSRIALDSPITTACRFENDPFWVNENGFRTHLPNPYLDEIDLKKFAARAMTNAAIVVPVHMAFGHIGAVSFNPIDPTQTDLTDAFAQHGDLLGIFARTFITSYSKVMGSKQALPPGSRLSKREVECLRWAAIGKTDLEISMIMGRSRATIRFHIHNASVKLDAVNRGQTLFKAAQLGYISLSD